MKTKYRSILYILILSAGVSLAAIEPAPQTYVEDRAGILDASTRQQLIGLLQELEQKTMARVIVLTVQTTGGIPIERYSFERADKWKFGANQKGASALVVVAVKDRAYRIEVGYNWEGVLPDSLVGSLGREYFVPYFKAGKYDQGILAGVAAMVRTIAQEKGVTLSGMPNLGRPRPQANQPQNAGSACCCLISGIVIFWIVAKLARQNPGLLFLWLLTSLLSGGGGRSGGSWSSGGGGFGGGGFGSFGGGGGGGFGGGGASGKW